MPMRAAVCTWFLEIILFANIGVCVCPLLRALITSHMKSMRNNRASLFLYVALAVNKHNGHGLSNTARRKRLPKKTKVMQH